MIFNYILAIINIFLCTAVVKKGMNENNLLKISFFFIFFVYFCLRPLDIIIYDLFYGEYPISLFWKSHKYFKFVEIRDVLFLPQLCVTIFLFLYVFYERFIIKKYQFNKNKISILYPINYPNIILFLILGSFMLPFSRIGFVTMIMIIISLIGYQYFNKKIILSIVYTIIVLYLILHFSFLFKERRDLIGYILIALLSVIYYKRSLINIYKTAIISVFLFLIMVMGAILVKIDSSTLFNIVSGENMFIIHNFIQDMIDFPIIYDDYVFLVNSIFNDKVDLLYGQSFYKILFWPIPRSIWLDKTWDTAQQFMTLFQNYRTIYDVYTSRPPSLLGEWIWNFGFVGLPTLPLIIGIIIKYAYRHQMRKGFSIPLILTILAFIGFIRGNFPVVLKELFIMYLFYKGLFFLTDIITRRKKLKYVVSV
jgi:hypothetical protein